MICSISVVQCSFKRDSDDAEGDYGSKNVSLYYSIPWKNYLLTLSGSKYSYHQTVAGAFESYTYSGESQQMKANLSRLLTRGSLHKTYVNAALWTKKSSITTLMTPKLKCNVVEQQVGKWGLITPNTLVKLFYNCLRTINVVRVGINPYQHRKKNLVKALLACRFLPQALILPILSLSAINLSALTPVGMDNGTGTPLTQQDKLSIGGRYTVRGFDGELSLSGEKVGYGEMSSVGILPIKDMSFI